MNRVKIRYQKYYNIAKTFFVFLVFLKNRKDKNVMSNIVKKKIKILSTSIPSQ